MADVFCFDTSAFLEAYRRHYPMDLFPTLWSKLDKLAGGGQVIAPDQVGEELSQRDDDLAKWLKPRKGMFVPLDDHIQKAVAEVLDRFPRLVDTVRGRSRADPFAVALARVRDCALVSHERFSRGAKDRPRIPDACSHFGVKHMTVIEFMREQKWRF